MTCPFGHVFQDPPDDVDEPWRFGILIGGMATWPDDLYVARAYAEAAACLMDQAPSAEDSSRLAYPILFLYRHALELYLKAAVQPAPGKLNHSLPELIEALDSLLAERMGTTIPGEMKKDLLTFAALDPNSQGFRYTTRKDGVPLLLSKPEHWLAHANLREFMETVFRGLEQVYYELHR